MSRSSEDTVKRGSNATLISDLDIGRAMAPLTCGVGLFCVGVMLIFVGTVLLCTLGFTVLLPYHSTSQWVPTTCTTTSSSCCTPVCACVKHATDDVDCLEGFPCVVITVTYDAMRTGDDVNVTHTSTLYRSWADAFFNTVRCEHYSVNFRVSRTNSHINTRVSIR